MQNDYLTDLCDYQDRIQLRLKKDLKKYGFSWENLVNAFKLSANEKKQLEEKWLDYYNEVMQEIGDDIKIIKNIHIGKQERKECEKKANDVYEKLFLTRPALPAPSEYQNYLEFLRIGKLIVNGGNIKAKKGF